jgi:hypothetical protein
MAMDAVDFLEWQSTEVRRREYALEDDYNEREQKIEIKAGRIRERDIRGAVRVVFEKEFERPCELRCGQDITVDNFYVAKTRDSLSLCCRVCSQSHARNGFSTRARIATLHRRHAWGQVSAPSVRSHCFVCGPDGGSIHFYLDAWHTGHNVAKFQGGALCKDRAEPLYVLCSAHAVQL